MSYIIVAYFTTDSLYTEAAKQCIKSLQKFNLSYEITPIENQGGWYKNVQYKPTFLKSKLEKFYPRSLVYIDIDAVVCREPVLFEELENLDIDIAVHLLDHSKRRRKNLPFEMLSGTIFLKNNDSVRIIVDEWIKECQKDPKVWDQKALAKVLKNKNFHILPEEYCMIFDYMRDVANPVIKHYQASRQSRDIGEA